MNFNPNNRESGQSFFELALIIAGVALLVILIIGFLPGAFAHPFSCLTDILNGSVQACVMVSTGGN